MPFEVQVFVTPQGIEPWTLPISIGMLYPIAGE